MVAVVRAPGRWGWCGVGWCGRAGVPVTRWMAVMVLSGAGGQGGNAGAGGAGGAGYVRAGGASAGLVGVMVVMPGMAVVVGREGSNGGFRWCQGWVPQGASGSHGGAW